MLRRKKNEEEEKRTDGIGSRRNFPERERKLEIAISFLFVLTHGAIQLTLILRAPASPAAERVRPMTACYISIYLTHQQPLSSCLQVFT